MNCLEVMKMPQIKKDYKALNIKLEANIYKQLEKYAESSRLTKTAIVELALEDYLKDKTNKD